MEFKRLKPFKFYKEKAPNAVLIWDVYVEGSDEPRMVEILVDINISPTCINFAEVIPFRTTTR